MYTTVVTVDDCLLSCRSTDSHLQRITSTNCCIHTVVPPDDRPRYARNMHRLTKYTKNKLCIKLVFLYTSNLLSLTNIIGMLKQRGRYGRDPHQWGNKNSIKVFLSKS